MAQKGFGAALGLSGLLLGALASAAEPPAAVTVRMIHPDEQLRHLLALFEGARVPHPAAALAAWKRANAPRGQLGKPLEAAIAALNPAMAAELRSLDQTELVLRFDADDSGVLRWYATLPHDDGTFAALAPALALTVGGSDHPLNGVAVDRLGPPGAPLMARPPRGLALAGSRPALAAALDPARLRADLGELDSGWLIGIDRDGLARSESLNVRRLAAALAGLGCTRVVSSAGLTGETFALDIKLRSENPPPAGPALDPAWLDAMPEAGLLAAFAWAIDPTVAGWDRVFALADRVEKADPARAGVAPLRTRINLLAAAVKVRPEADLWPQLRGVSGAVVADAVGHVDAVVLALHTTSPEAAARIAGQIIPRLAPLLGVHGEAEPSTGDAAPRRLGELHHRHLLVSRQSATVRLHWGRVVPGPGRSLGPLLPNLPGDGGPLPQRFAAFWPGRLVLPPAVGRRLARALGEAPPVVWTGRDVAAGGCENIRWPGLRGLVHQFLDGLLLDPPADH